MSLVVLTPKIIVWGRTLAEHNERLNKVFLKIPKSELKLNKKKCQIGGKVHCISWTYIWRHTSWPSKNWDSHKNAITKFCLWTPAILRHHWILRKVHTKSCLSDLSLSYPAKERSLQNSSRQTKPLGQKRYCESK